MLSAFRRRRSTPALGLSCRWPIPAGFPSPRPAAGAKYVGCDPQFAGALYGEIRTTPLDPMRPARDLLEDVVGGIRGCWLLYQESAEIEDEEDEDASADAFLDAVRTEADKTRDPLT